MQAVHPPSPSQPMLTPWVQVLCGTLMLLEQLCSAPLLANRAGDGYEPENSYYYIGHFSRFIRPGARRLASESTAAELEAIAFANPDGSTVVVAMNRQDHPLRYTLTVGEQSHVAELPPRSIATYVR